MQPSVFGRNEGVGRLDEFGTRVGAGGPVGVGERVAGGAGSSVGVGRDAAVCIGVVVAAAELTASIGEAVAASVEDAITSDAAGVTARAPHADRTTRPTIAAPRIE